MKIVVIGFGNYLMSDDGVGIHAVHKLLDASLPEHVGVFDGGVNAFAALSYIENATKVLFIDAMAGGGNPGDLYRVTPEELGDAFAGQALSVHDFSLQSVLAMEKYLNPLPPVTIFGIEPGKVELGTDLSPEVSSAMDVLIDIVLQELR